MVRSLILVASLLLLASLALATPEKPLARLAFGSCNKQWLNQPIWKSIIDYNPDVFVWLGDVVYLDTMPFPLVFVPSTMERNKEQYLKQKNNKSYRELADNVRVLGVWDDHDYGLNNAGGDSAIKEDIRKFFLDFLNESKDSPRWTRDGIYESYEFGPAGKKVKLILLDVRWSRDPLGMTEGDILGKEQWEWLEKELKESDAQVHLIGSGTQFLPYDKPVIEKWSQFPQARKKLLHLLNHYQVPGVVVLSGDVHYGEILKSEKVLTYPMWEITSSGLTHSWHDDLPPKVFDFLANLWLKSTYQFSEFFPGKNFGTADFFWDSNPRIEFALRDVNGTVVRSVSVPLGQLEYRKEVKTQDENILYRYTQLTTMESYLYPFVAGLALVGLLVLSLLFCCVKSLFSSSKKQDLKKKKQ
eukprot:TRINITY_DN7342_c0_g1_i1.p1 TRINITY_DN7342_c0_g1~~TRINITY_DN7342_c0_g1_i1.p1  ORF type:complete len:414 (-),score=96.20 TRINITY_DN7342_c0_g1_i1:31-1272(-)